MTDAAPPITHADLCGLSELWLRTARGCGFAFRELACGSSSRNGEIPDAIGWTSTASILVECKVSRSDFLADRGKPYREHPEMGMGNYRWYCAPAGIIAPTDLPPQWGLVELNGRRLRAVVAAEHQATNLIAERALCYSALRRLSLRGHLQDIYLDEGVEERAVPLQNTRSHDPYALLENIVRHQQVRGLTDAEIAAYKADLDRRESAKATAQDRKGAWILAKQGRPVTVDGVTLMPAWCMHDGEQLRPQRLPDEVLSLRRLAQEVGGPAYEAWVAEHGAEQAAAFLRQRLVQDPVMEATSDAR